LASSKTVSRYRDQFARAVCGFAFPLVKTSMTTTRVTTIAIGLAALCAAGLTAQTQETQTTTKTKIEIKGGKDVTAIGCLERRSNGDYILTDVRDTKRLESTRYALVTSQDLSKGTMRNPLFLLRS
jgi:hypothetical protein